MNNNVKKEGQVFTPKYIVHQMLNYCNYTSDRFEIIVKTKILEPSFGDGAFLTEILYTLLEATKSFHTKEEQIELIKRNIFGIEKDQYYYDIAIERLNQILKCFDIYDFDWSKNLLCTDTLAFDEFDNKFDIVIGNPPYVNIHNIDDRELIKTYNFAIKGMTDLYICFFEKGLKMLNSNGILCFITPNSYFNSKTAFEMRKYIVDKKLLTRIYNFGHTQVFENATTYSCITILSKKNNSGCFEYTDHKTGKTKTLYYTSVFINNILYPNVSAHINQIINFSNNDLAKVKNGCATLKDEFFIGSTLAENSKFSVKILKSSTGTYKKCFYPYDSSGFVIDFETIQEQEPETADFLLKHKHILLKRNIDKNGRWYAFGRSQAIKDTYSYKIGINTIFKTKEDVKLYDAFAGTAVYGGFYILTNAKYEDIEKILISDDFIEYASTIGRYKNGGYYSLTTKEIERFLNYKLSKI